MVVVVLADLLDRIEFANQEVFDPILELFSGLLQTSDSDVFCYRTFWPKDDLPITIKETRALISQGTTGLTSWDGALLMSGVLATDAVTVALGSVL